MADESRSERTRITGNLPYPPIFDSEIITMRRVADETIIEHEGKTGVFVPLTDADSPEISRDNLETVTQALREEISKLRTENLQLKQSLDTAVRKPARTPDDFATAITHAVDSLQTRLNDTKNPVSRFAVKNMSIEASVHVDVSPLGTVEYRFISLEDNVDASKLARIKLDLVPLPKESSSGSWGGPDFTPFHPIDDIQGIGERYRETLNRNNIYTVSDLLNAGTRVRSQVELATLLDVDARKLHDWLGHAELLTIKSIDNRAAEVLHSIGITSLDALAQAEVPTLTEAYNAKVEQLGHATHQPVQAERAADWIRAAGVFVGRKDAGETAKNAG